MAQALSLARRAEGRTAPNPPVGAVVVKRGRVVGRGFHAAAGRPHAEAIALDQAGPRARGSDLYVTLEPCNHTGRTPPCTDKIIAAGVGRVIFSQPDPNPGVAGGGAERLRRAGIQVESGLLAERGAELLRPFSKLVTASRPFVSLKMAASLDGRIATAAGQSQWLTGPQAKRWLHRLRDRCEAILVGRGTAAVDDPALTTRLERGRGQNPLRVILDSSLSLDPKARVVSGPKEGGPAGGGCLVFCSPQAPGRRRRVLEAAGAEVMALPAGEGGVDPLAALRELGRRGVMHLLLEGGPEAAASFLRAGLVDEILFLMAPRLIGGRAAPGLIGGADLPKLDSAAKLGRMRLRRLGSDLLIQTLVEP